MSDYRIQIIHVKTGKVAKSWQPGTYVETDLANELCERTKEKGIGFFRSEARVLSCVREALAELLLALKRKV